MSPHHEASVVQLRAGVHQTVDPLPGLDPALTTVRDWPERLAVIIGQATHPAVVSAVSNAGFEPVLMSTHRASAMLHSLGPVVFFVLGADVFCDDESVEMVRAWHGCSPSARLKLVYPGEQRDPAVLLRAMRAGVTDVIDPADRTSIDETLRNGLLRAGAARERVLAIGAHPDDVEIGCGGTLLDHRRRGDRISILTLSQGAIGGDTRHRVSEAAACADTIGAQLIMGNLPDTEIDDGIATIRMIESVVQRLSPTVVYVHSANDNHQDHRAVSTATRSATRGVRRVFAYQSPSATNSFLPTQFVNIDETVRGKVEVLQMFASQDGRTYLEPDLVVAGARYWARHLGANARYAEPFEVIRSVGELRLSATAPVAVPEPRRALSAMAMPPTTLEHLPPAVSGHTLESALSAVGATS